MADTKNRFAKLRLKDDLYPHVMSSLLGHRVDRRVTPMLT